MAYVTKFQALRMCRSLIINRSCLIFFKLDHITIHDPHMCRTWNLGIRCYILLSICDSYFEIRYHLHYIDCAQSWYLQCIQSRCIHGIGYQVWGPTYVQISHNQQILFDLFKLDHITVYNLHMCRTWNLGIRCYILWFIQYVIVILR
jgi:hypothetical protein